MQPEREALDLKNYSIYGQSNLHILNVSLNLYFFLLIACISSSLDVQQHCLCSLCNLAGFKECAPTLVNKGAVGSIMRMTSVMKNDEVFKLGPRLAEAKSPF